MTQDVKHRKGKYYIIHIKMKSSKKIAFTLLFQLNKYVLQKFPDFKMESSSALPIQKDESKDGTSLCQNDALRDKDEHILIRQNDSTNNINNSLQSNKKLHDMAMRVDKIAAIFLPLLFLFIGIVYWIAFWSHR